jgi:hypothetical protein
MGLTSTAICAIIEALIAIFISVLSYLHNGIRLNKERLK